REVIKKCLLALGLSSDWVYHGIEREIFVIPLAGLYGAITEFAEKHCEPTAKQERWGTGFRNRREVIKKCLLALGLSSDWVYHGIEREIFVIPLA
ncbi:Druantia anti-phage system protein DruA, partial [Streptococcus pneumoniae]|uniref:Druantia anti-phage system protein DruA n=1 Tax=Streptococcus pneumoniae TaxID=1313 RepID=UPI001CB77E32